MSNVHALPGSAVPTAEPNAGLIALLREMLAMAEDGRLQSFIGTGFCADGGRVRCVCDMHQDVYQMLGAIAWLQAEYLERHTEAKR